MSSADAMSLLNDAELEKLLVATPDMSDSFTALMESIIARRKDATEVKIEDIKKFREGLATTDAGKKQEDLTNLYNNYSAVIKRDFGRGVRLLVRLRRAVEGIAKAAPSSLILDKDTLNEKVLFTDVKATAAGKAFKEAIIDATNEIDFVIAELDEIRLSRAERVNLRESTRDSISAIAGRSAIEQQIIDAREAVAVKEDAFMKNFVDDTTGISDRAKVRNLLRNANYKKGNNQSELLSLVSQLISTVGMAITARMVAERDFLRSQGMNIDGMLTSEARLTYLALKSYESKVYGNLHTYPQINIKKLPYLFTAYKERAESITPPLYVADRAARKAFTETATRGDIASRAEVMEAELTAGI